MLYCLNPTCQKSQNEGSSNICANCGSNLLLSDRYYASKIIGQGGFGKTYLAIDRADSSLCVIKQFSYLSSSTALRLFAEEAQRLKALGLHPQIPTFIDYIEQENQYFIVQEYIDGSNLEEELAANGAFAENQIEQLLADILPVIKFVHEGGVIHRDIKPENIIRRRSDRKLCLVDFGASKRATETSLAKTGTTIGSAGYAAPEQTFGKAVVQSDLYSLGVTCVHLLTGLHPFDLIDSASGDWAWRDYLKQPVNKILGEILDKLLERGTRQRYQSAAEVLRDLQLPAEDDATISKRELINDATKAASELSKEVSKIYKQASTQQLPTRHFHAGKIAAVGLLVVGGLVAIPVATNVLNQSQVAKVPQEQVRKAPVPIAKPVIPQKPYGQPQQSQENKAENAILLKIISIGKSLALLLFIISALVMPHRSINQGEDVHSAITPVIAALILVLIMNAIPSLFELDVATVQPTHPTLTNDSL